MTNRFDALPIAQQGRALYRLLVQPAQGELDAARRVLISPDDVLHTLAFAALIAPAKGNEPEGYLVQRKPLHAVLSMSVYDRVRKEAAQRGRPAFHVLAFGDPLYARADHTSQPQPSDAELAPIAIHSRLMSHLMGRQKQPLPWTGHTVNYLKRLYPGYVEAYTGKLATKQTFLERAGKASLLYAGCHGYADDVTPFASALALAENKEGDGVLTGYELMDKGRLNADLVVLAACETGLGQIQKMEGMVGLTRAFQYAGAKSVVVSLWPVREDRTADLMERLFFNLKQGRTKDMALQQAQCELMKRDNDPLHWAAFQLEGDFRSP